jgi:hypothetical protein
VEQSYKQTKGALGWSDYQVRSDRAIQRHWTLVCCAFSFCWYHQSHASPGTDHLAETKPAPTAEAIGGKNRDPASASPKALVASGTPGSTSVAGALDHALALLARVVESAPASAAATAP